jgi:reverse gyrase
MNLFDKLDEDGDWLYASVNFILSEKLDSIKLKLISRIIDLSPSVQAASKNIKDLLRLIEFKEKELDEALNPSVPTD